MLDIPYSGGGSCRIKIRHAVKCRASKSGSCIQQTGKFNYYFTGRVARRALRSMLELSYDNFSLLLISARGSLHIFQKKIEELALPRRFAFFDNLPGSKKKTSCGTHWVDIKYGCQKMPSRRGTFPRI